MNKKGQVMQGLANLGVGIAVFTVVIIIAFIMMAQTKTNMIGSGNGGCDNSSWHLNTSQDVCCLTGATSCLGANQSTGFSLAFNSTSSLQNSAATLPGWLGLVVLVAIGAIVLGMIAMFQRR